MIEVNTPAIVVDTNLVLADVNGPGIVRELRIKMSDANDAELMGLNLQVFYDDQNTPAIDIPVAIGKINAFFTFGTPNFFIAFRANLLANPYIIDPPGALGCDVAITPLLPTP